MTRRWQALAVGLGLACVGGLTVTAVAGQTFRTGVDAVAVDVLVTRDGRPVTGLTADDFSVRDNDVPQRIDAVLLEDVPITLLLVLDTSGSVGGAPLVQLRAAAEAAVEALRPDDRVGLVTRRVLEREGAGFDREERGQSPGHDTLVSPVFFLQDQPTYLRARVRPNAAGAGPSEIPIDASFASRNIVPDDLPRDGSHVLETIPLRTDQGFPPGTVLLRIKRVE